MTSRLPTSVRAITVHQPWAHLIMWQGKDVENRSWSTSHRGALVIHAGATVDRRALAAAREAGVVLPSRLATGAALGVVHLADVHHATECWRYRSGRGRSLCSPWAEHDAYHWVLTNRHALSLPVPCPGARRLWRPPPDVLAVLRTAHRRRDVALAG